jgi:hypothetical protein
MTRSRLDKYARDAQVWRGLAELNYAACRELFTASLLNPALYFVAVTLAHNALELFLKTALICEGMTVFNPKNLKSLDASVGLKPSDCIWGHASSLLLENLLNGALILISPQKWTTAFWRRRDQRQLRKHLP